MSATNGDLANGHDVVPHIIDMRSDTVTRPTDAMRKAMANAIVGDDVYGDDPTINELQSYAAAITGKEAALFVPSGTMGNLISVLTHCNQRGDEFIVGDQAHIHMYEQGGSATLGGVHPRIVKTEEDGTLPVKDIINCIRTSTDDHFPISRLICLENTHNRMGGRVLSKAYIDRVAMIAREYKLALHMDGARIFNAATSLNTSVKELVENCDSVSICLSKGLAAPVGSIIVGQSNFILQAKRLRKALGGGMRQAGILAAAGLIALKDMSLRLTEDHKHAALLAAGLSTIPGLSVGIIETNIVFVTVSNPFPLDVGQLKESLKSHHILIGVTAINKVRFVIHYEITEQDIQTVLQTVKQLASKEGQ